MDAFDTALARAPWTPAAWLPLLNSDAAPLAVRRRRHARALALLPSNAPLWASAIRLELQAGDVPAAEALISRCLLDVPHPAVFEAYLATVIESKLKPAEAAVATAAAPAGASASDAAVAATKAAQGLAAARSAVAAAYAFALQTLGSGFEAGPLWAAYFDFLASGVQQANSLAEVSAAKEALKAAYKAGAAAATSAVDSAWDGWCAACGGTGPEADAGAPAYRAARALFEARGAAWRGLDASAAAVGASGLDGDADLNAAAAPAAAATGAPWLAARRARGPGPLDTQAARWARVLALEAENRLSLSPHAHAALVRLHQKQALLVLRHLPEAWFAYVSWEASAASSGGSSSSSSGGSPLPPQAAAAAASAVAANPASLLLALAIADLQESGGSGAAAKATLEAAIERLERLASAAPMLPTTDERSEAAVLAAIDAAVAAGVPVTPLSLPSVNDVEAAAAALPTAYIALQRLARRTSGVEGARAAFAAARRSPHVTPGVYLAAAHSEVYACGRGLQVARNVIEAGRKRFPRHAAFLVGAADLLAAADEAAPLRAFFESALTELGSSCAAARPLWDRYVAAEVRGGGSLTALKALVARRAAAFPHLEDASGQALLPVLALHACSLPGGSLPAACEPDAGFLARTPFTPFALLEGGSDVAPAEGTPAALAGGGAGIVDGWWLQSPPMLPEVDLALVGCSHVPPVWTRPAPAAVSLPGVGDGAEALAVLGVDEAPMPVPRFLKALLASLPALDTEAAAPPLPDEVLEKLVAWRPPAGGVEGEEEEEEAPVAVAPPAAAARVFAAAAAAVVGEGDFDDGYTDSEDEEGQGGGAGTKRKKSSGGGPPAKRKPSA